ncbi:MAG: tetratricopeptide repeat protein [Gemmatimonadota bacterium]|nr:tetratricopeptide repeat protein [Gemmatimonadota bacterium]
MPDVGPADVPRLAEEASERPDDLETRTRLGIAQYRAGNVDAALENLRRAVEDGHETGPALLHLGLAHESREEWAEAREAYGRYLDRDASGTLRSDIENRLQLMGRNLLRERAREALELERRVADRVEPTPRSVAVLPFGFNSERADIEPLIYALADMMSTDFAVSDALVVLERAQVQSLLDEMALTEAGYAEEETGARAGRLLRAEHVVQGVITTLGGDRLRTDANVVNVASGSEAGDLNETAALEQLFAMEKALVIRTIREVLGVELTPAEEQAILDNRMDNVLAFVAYGEGLRALDRGNYADAEERFQAAISLEGGSNDMLESALETTSGLSEAEDTDTETLASRARAPGAVGGGPLAPPAGSTTGAEETGGDLSQGTLTNVTEGVAPTPTSGLLDLGSTDQAYEQPKQTGDTERQPVEEASGESGIVGSSGTIRLVIPRPGGER